jgi:hypothetical protein
MSGGPGPVDEGPVYTVDMGEQVAQHRQRAVGDGEQIGQRSGQRGALGGAEESNVAPARVADQPGGYEPRRFGVYGLDAGIDELGGFSQAVLAIGVEVQQGEQVTYGSELGRCGVTT